MSLKVSEIFPSIQGEGVQIGMPMTFVRLQGCNLSCDFCDTKYALDPRFGNETNINDIVSEVQKNELEWVCITGGEPLFQDITGLLRQLHHENFKITVETNGTLVPSVEQDALIDLWTASPKVGHWNQKALEAMHPLQLKIVLVEGMLLDIEKWRNVKPDYIVVQPCALTPFNVDQNRKHLRGAAEWIIKARYNDVRLIPQLHKYIWGDTRGK